MGSFLCAQVKVCLLTLQLWSLRRGSATLLLVHLLHRARSLLTGKHTPSHLPAVWISGLRSCDRTTHLVFVFVFAGSRASTFAARHFLIRGGEMGGSGLGETVSVEFDGAWVCCLFWPASWTHFLDVLKSRKCQIELQLRVTQLYIVLAGGLVFYLFIFHYLGNVKSWYERERLLMRAMNPFCTVQ